MKVFLTGATGYIGSAVAEALQKAGHQVIGLVRTEEKARRLESRGIRALRGDLGSLGVIAQGAREADGVIHTANTNDASAAQADEAAIDAILKVLEGTQKAFVYTSGIWVMGNTGDHVADESALLDPTPIIAWRVAVEQKILAPASRGIRSVVIRPAMVYGRGGGVPAMFVQWARERGAARYIGTGENRWTFVHVEDLADLYVRALETAPAGSLFTGADGPAIRLREVAEAASIGASAQGRTEAWPLEEARKAMGPVADALALDQQVSGEKAKRLLGWKPQGSICPRRPEIRVVCKAGSIGMMIPARRQERRLEEGDRAGVGRA